MEKSDLSFRKLIVAALWRVNWKGKKWWERSALGAVVIDSYTVKSL